MIGFLKDAFRGTLAASRQTVWDVLRSCEPGYIPAQPGRHRSGTPAPWIINRIQKEREYELPLRRRQFRYPLAMP